ncbi:hypothetical protein IIE18_11670 [Pseudomonas sp. V1]|uniref:hypothetical protein n=1 Tax=Pseudomonas arcuscaelestis TaxID=2710591 RepID=UPI00193FD81D|nr:hypothetical protein [Pseudomonas arcuscaelestis]MBM3105796.1 hypothetical protein [Pseudomonas arcuscaelestis]
MHFCNCRLGGHLVRERMVPGRAEAYLPTATMVCQSGGHCDGGELLSGELVRLACAASMADMTAA